ncbi:MAG: acyl carrier protein [Candidatus Fimadaptatus sp.]|jgi:acyl carrier protein|nr:acyl carrier protein [Candidatus Fimadaptatus sp.]
MTENQIFDKVAELIALQMGIDKSEITMKTRMLEDLKADSANIIMLVMDLENEFDIAVDDDVLMGIKTVGDVVNCIKGLVA